MIHMVDLFYRLSYSFNSNDTAYIIDISSLIYIYILTIFVKDLGH